MKQADAAARKALLDLLLRKEGVRAASESGMMRLRQQKAPLSFAQQRLWFWQEFNPDSPAYNIPAVARLSGPLDIAAFRDSFREIVCRHEILRTSFVMENDQPVQVIIPEATFSIPIVDLRPTKGSRGQTAELERLTLAEVQRPFDLAQAPLMRALLLQAGDTEYLFVLTMHHIVSDGWSIGVFMQELATLYPALQAGDAQPLPALPIQYADFASWQRQWLQGDRLQRQLRYWQESLAGAPALLELPTDRPRPPLQTTRGGALFFELDAPLTAGLEKLSQQLGGTLFMTLLSSFAVLLARYAGQQDIVIGSPIANRTRDEIEALIGFFVNMLPLRIKLTGNPRFDALFAQVRESSLGAFAHQDLPFEKLVDSSQVERNLNYHPVFQVAFSLDNAPARQLKLSNLSLTLIEPERTTAKFDLTLSMEMRGQQLVGEFEYNRDLFDTATIERAITHFQTLLQSIVRDPTERIAQLNMLPAAERQQLLITWNDTGTAYPKTACVHQLFEEQVRAMPAATALTFAEAHLTYAELNRRANQIAHALRQMGVGPETPVGLAIERSPEMIIGMLAIIKAGGVFVPLDLSYPAERLSFMLQDTRIKFLLTQESLLDQLPPHEALALCLDRDGSFWQQQPESNPPNLTCADNCIYIMYTSGSTGIPKGVAIPHRGVVRLVKTTNYSPFTADEVFFQSSAVTFDASTLEIWGSLLNGARLVLPPPGLASFEERDRLLLEHRVSTYWITTGLFHKAVEENAVGLRQAPRIWTGGEVLSVPIAARLLEELHGRGVLTNFYGPTENTTYTTFYLIADKSKIGNNVPIGKPIANSQVYVLSPQMEPTPIGIPGELYVGGDGLARGYANRPGLTAERFVPHPFAAIPGERLYRTGDLVRYLADGNIEFIGRVDHQVKIRGFRVEVGEIETALRKHHVIQDALIVPYEDRPGSRKLIAYIICHPGQARPDIHLLRQYLGETLPDYMLPAYYIWMDTFPLNSSGKVDRHRLPRPEQSRPELAVGYMPAQTPIEQQLMEIWRDVLGLSQVGIYDNFFEMGGDSIISIQMVARANRRGLQLSPQQIFQNQTIAELAAVVDTAPVTTAAQNPVTGPAPLTPVQRWFFEQKLTNPHHFNQSVLLQVAADVDSAALQEAMRQVLIHHDALRLRFGAAEDGWQPFYLPPSQAFLSFEIVDIAVDQSLPVVLNQVAADLQTGLNLAAGPLMRAALLRQQNGETGRLLLVIHHLVVDGVSWRILLEDLSTAYRQLHRGEAVRLPAKTTSFQTWSTQLVDYAGSDALQAEINHWITAPDSARLPVDYPEGRPANTEQSAQHLTTTLTAAETRALLQQVPAAYNTQINEILLTALAKTVAWWTGEQHIRLDLEGHGRESIIKGTNLTRTVGWFTTIFPVHLALKSDATLDAAIKSIKEQLRRVPVRGLGYGVLRYLASDESLRNQLAAAMPAELSFNYLGQFDVTKLEAPFCGLAAEPRGAEVDPIAPRRYLLEVTSSITENELHITWTYSENVHHHETIDRLAQQFIHQLGEIIHHCLAVESGQYTPSDFPDLEIGQDDLDALLAEIAEVN